MAFLENKRREEEKSILQVDHGGSSSHPQSANLKKIANEPLGQDQSNNAAGPPNSYSMSKL